MLPKRRFWAAWLLLLAVAGSALAGPDRSQAGWQRQVERLTGTGGVLVTDLSGRVLFGRNQNKRLIPASIVKIITAAAALDKFGAKYRFQTFFYLTKDKDLVISGRGDPLLISEEVAWIATVLAGRLRARGLEKIRHIVTDASYFATDFHPARKKRTDNPYDAFNTALAVNFNTINVNISETGRISPAEPQTPLTPLAIHIAEKSPKQGQVRLNLSTRPTDCLLYAGELFRAFLVRTGIRVTGRIRMPGGKSTLGQPLLKYNSRFTLDQVVAKMMKYSSNFTANQLWLTLGAQDHGPPGRPSKSKRSMTAYLASVGVEGVRLDEGSGLSRRNRLSPTGLVKILSGFKKHHRLLVKSNGGWVKTGTLTGVQSLAGYIDSANRGLLPFAIILNGPEARPGTRERIFKILVRGLGGR